MSAVPKNLRAFAGMLESINEAIAVLDKVESVEQFTREHQERVDKLQAEAALAAGTVVLAKDALAEAQRAALATIEQAKAEAQSIRDDATDAGIKIVASARAEAEASKAKENASEAAERKARAGLAEATKAIQSATAQLAEINDRIEKAKADARARFGA